MAEQISTNRTVTPNEAKRSIEKCVKIQRPVFMWGPPGIGKSDIVKQIGDKQGREVIDVRLSLWEPTDIKGIPYYNSTSNTMTWAPPAELPTDPESTAILFLDELNSAAPATSLRTSAPGLLLRSTTKPASGALSVSVLIEGDIVAPLDEV